MIRAVLDTNVLASGFVRPEPAPGQILLEWKQGHFELLLSDHILDELATTFEQPFFSRHLSPEERADDLRLLRQRAAVVALTEVVTGVATHPEDDPVLATAVSGGADYLVTGDFQLQRLGSYRGVTIVNPRSFLQILRDRGARRRTGQE